MRAQSRFVWSLQAVLTLASMLAGPALAHHSFAAYNMDVTKVFTGVVTRVNPDANHLQIFFAPMNEERKNVLRDGEGKPIIWAVEMAGSAQMAKEGVSVDSFPPGTIFSIGLHPLRDGQNAGTRGPNGAIYRCPAKTPPPAGKHCDVVAGSVEIGKGGLLKPQG
ncbi:MAG TPA: DUF6152 family protein [Steroidobacteraceae bacterium]|nr:DUF6152 family protein [Steroidobacteraceae bacterium]